MAAKKAAPKKTDPKPPKSSMKQMAKDAPGKMGQMAANSRGQKAVSARMSKQAERGVGVSAKKSERAAVINKADKVFGKGNYNLISGARLKVPTANPTSFGYAGSGKLTAVSKGVGSVKNAQTKITASNSPSATIYNPWKTKTTTYVTRKPNKPSSQIKKK